MNGESAPIAVQLSTFKIKGYFIGAGVLKMKKIKNVKLGLNPTDYAVVVSADIEMNGKKDKDDLYLVMFNIMDNPLRLSVLTIGNLLNLIVKSGQMSQKDAEDLMVNNPEKFIQSALSSSDNIADLGKENVKIMLDSESNAKKARIVLTSMIDKKHYLQNSTYYFEGEPVEKSQEVDTTQLIPQLKMMIEIVKRWDGFDAEQFQKDAEAGKIKF